MRQVVADNYHRFSEPLEGRLGFMYLCSADPRGHVTVGVGNLCSLVMATGLPFQRPNGSFASRAEIAAEWLCVDSHQELKKQGGRTFANFTTLRLSEDAIDVLVQQKLHETDRTLRGMFSRWEDWPACAQLALLSWAWAVGPASRYPRMHAALHNDDFLEASAECLINPKRGTIITRNERNVILLRNAAKVRAYDMDPDFLDWTAEIPDRNDTDISAIIDCGDKQA